jgi:hypothetical protein
VPDYTSSRSPTRGGRGPGSGRPSAGQFANDSAELRATDVPLLEYADAATWLPPNCATWCNYVARQVAVKVKYGLWVTSAEYDAITLVLNGCPGEPLPS